MAMAHKHAHRRVATTSRPGISIVIPTLNEAANVGPLFERIKVALAVLTMPYELIVVDDRSTDATTTVALQNAKRLKLPVRVVQKEGRLGKSFSLIQGFGLARYTILGMIDGDLQFPPEAFPAMIAQLEHAQIVIGDRRATYHETSLRGLLSQAYRTLFTKYLFGIDTDMQSGIKVFYRTLYEAIDLEPGPWSFDIDLVSQAALRGFTIANVPITFSSRVAGTSKVQPLRVGAELALHALRVRLTHRRHARVQQPAEMI